MEQMEHWPQKSVGYFFLRSKDVHIENGAAFITFFARLTREISSRKEGVEEKRIQPLWVEIDEVLMDHASEKAKAMPNCMQRYELTPNVFNSLYQLSKVCPAELFYITPYHLKSTHRKFIT